MTADSEEQKDELLALQSIFSSEEFGRNESNVGGEIRVDVEVPAGFSVAVKEGEVLSQYEISFLPPLLLNFDLPEDYPSSSPPSFTLTCSWLSHTQLSALSAQLTDIYLATGGAVVLFTWVQFLREDALGFLDVRNLLELQSDQCQAAGHQPGSHRAPDLSCNATARCEEDISAPQDLSASAPAYRPSRNGSLPNSPGGSSQPTSASLLPPSQRLLAQILVHDATRRQKRFASTAFECGVCFTTHLGSGCVKLAECGHVFCRACLAEFCKVQITEGNVGGVACPQGGCSSAPTPAQVQTLVGEELFGRYDRLLLQNSLERMPDVVYCPRRDCASAVIREKSSSAAMCSVCGFAFCIACRRTYHGAGDCRQEQSLAAHEDAEAGKLLLPKSQAGLTALWNDYISASKKRKRLLESRYGPLSEGLSSFLSDGWMAANTKLCPNCFTKIEKNGGCDMMRCSHCCQLFCWLCLAKLTPTMFGHVNGGTCNWHS